MTPPIRRQSLDEIFSDPPASSRGGIDAIFGRPRDSSRVDEFAGTVADTPLMRQMMGESMRGTGAQRGRMALQGATAGFADEVEAAVRAPFSDRTYAELRDNIRNDLAAFRQEAPQQAMGLELLGGVAGGQGLTRAMPSVARPAATAMGRVGQGIKVGAVAGGATGVGMAEDGENVLMEGLRGAAGGAVAGGAVSGGIEMFRALGPHVADLVRNATARPEERAQRVWARSLTDDGALVDGAPTPEVLERLRSAPADARMTLADVAGDNARRLTDAAAAVPGDRSGAVRTGLQKRAMQAGEQARDATREATGAPAQSLMETLDQLDGARATTARPLYDEATEGVTVTSPQLVDLLRTRPAVQKAWASARETALNRGEQMDDLATVLGRAEELPVLPARQVQRLKFQLDDELRKLDGLPGGKGSDNYFAIKALRDDVDNLLYEASPEKWGNAQRTYANMSRQIEAVEQGAQGDGSRLLKAFPNAPYEDVEYVLRGASDEVRQAYALGASRATEEVVSNARTQPAFFRKLLGDTREQQKYRLMFPRSGAGDDAFARWLNEMERQSNMRQTEYAVLGGSPTAPRLAAQEGLRDGLLSDVVEAAPRGVRGLADLAVRRGARGINAARMRGASQEVSQLAQLSSPAQIEALMEAIGTFASRNQIGPRRAATLGPTRAAATAGFLSGR